MRTLVGVMVVVALGGRVDAQPGMTEPVPPPVLDPTEHHTVCFVGRPFECRSVFVFEIGIRGGTATTWTGDLGLLVNRGRYAFGATIGVLGYDSPATEDGEASGVLKARFRHYLGDRGAAVDAAVGVGGFGVSGEVALGYRDVIALSAGIHTMAGDPDRPYAANVGVRFGTVAIAVLVPFALRGMP